MCWNWEVSLIFAIAQFLIFFYLAYRNRYFDRYWLLLVSPIALQEFCQFLLWKYGVNDRTTVDSCNDFNHICSRIIVVFVMLLPVLCAYICMQTIDKDAPKWIRICWKILFFYELVSYLILVITELTDDNFCIFVGEHGHLDWIQTIQSYLPEIISYELFYAYSVSFYMIPIVCATILYQPLWLLFPPTFYISTLFLALYIGLGSESFSVWCWSGSFILIWAIFYCKIALLLLTKFTEHDVENGNCLTKFCLKGAHDHYAKYNKKTVNESIQTTKNQTQLQMQNV